MRTENPFQITSTQIVYENPWIRVREDAVIRPDGSNGIYGVMESADSVVIIARNERDETYLIRSFSYPAAAWSWTLPGGGDDGEDAEIAARRELAEETGIEAHDWVSLGKIRVAGGTITERATFFLARDLLYKDREEADDKELIEGGKFVTDDEFDAMVQSGEVDDSQAITGMYLARCWLARAAIQNTD